MSEYRCPQLIHRTDERQVPIFTSVHVPSDSSPITCIVPVPPLRLTTVIAIVLLFSRLGRIELMRMVMLPSKQCSTTTVKANACNRKHKHTRIRAR